MKLSEVNQSIKDMFPGIIRGEYFDFTQDQLEYLIKLGFLFNHLSFTEDDRIIFEYNKCKLCITQSSISPSFFSKIPEYMSDEYYFSLITGDELFKKSLVSFMRGHKIDLITNQ